MFCLTHTSAQFVRRTRWNFDLVSNRSVSLQERRKSLLGYILDLSCRPSRCIVHQGLQSRDSRNLLELIRKCLLFSPTPHPPSLDKFTSSNIKWLVSPIRLSFFPSSNLPYGQLWYDMISQKKIIFCHFLVAVIQGIISEPRLVEFCVPDGQLATEIFQQTSIPATRVAILSTKVFAILNRGFERKGLSTLGLLPLHCCSATVFSLSDQSSRFSFTLWLSFWTQSQVLFLSAHPEEETSCYLSPSSLCTFCCQWRLKHS